MSDLYQSDNLATMNDKIDTATGLLAFERVIYLPFDLAILYAAAQNFRLDLAKGFHASAREWLTVQISYYAEAHACLLEDGCNLYPGENAEPWIHHATLGAIIMPTVRAITLNGIFDALFGHTNTDGLGSEFYPDPRVCNNDLEVAKAEQKLFKKIYHH